MRIHSESVDIAAPRHAVWLALVDFAEYPRWNRTITSAAGELRAGARLDLWLEMGSERRAFDPLVAGIEPEHLLLLQKTLITRALLHAAHAFRLVRLDDGRSRLTQEWSLSGMLAPLAWPRFRAGLPAFARMKHDIAREAERRAAHA